VTDVDQTELGRISIAPRALARAVVRSAEADDCARVRRPRRRLRIEIAEGRGARVSLELAVRRGCVLPETARGVQERVSETLHGMLGLEVEAVDVAVEEVDAR
jgi:uncharacterized alkaline shock family protein YloU